MLVLGISHSMKTSRFSMLRLIGALAAVIFAACETTPLVPAEKFIGDMVVVINYAQFFRLGPQQAGGADRSLRINDRVMLLRKEFGYSRVQLEDNQVGYMANEDIRPAPPEPKVEKPRRKKGGNSGGDGGGSQQYYEDIPITDPNLNILPEDIPMEPLPELEPDAPAHRITPQLSPDSPTPSPTPR